jgi:eukaryotic-like serine/threonine-protein kinase
MSLTPGTRLGPYEIVAPLGAGGMGEVFRAKDTRLDRTVAIKILPQQLSSDPTRKQRFEREAKTISGLNHPHICVLHDVGSQDGVDYLVMECMEGETLAKRLERGPMPAEQVLKFGAQIADALDKAHRAGIVHRDLKPGNIMLTSSGAKLLDFGLARPVVAMTNGLTLTAAIPTQSPVTQEGTIVGTFQYMSPEQLEGKEVDGRSDIFSLGGVLYEMLTGKRAFEGKSQLSVATAILEREPESIRTTKPVTPAALEHAIQRCLAKDLEERWQVARDLAIELNWIAKSGNQPGAAVLRPDEKKVGRWLAWGLLAAGLAVGLVVGMLAWRTPKAAQPSMHFLAALPFPSRGIALAPNGHTAAIVGYNEAERKNVIWIYEVGDAESKMLPGTDGANFPFWSPDGKSLAFFADGKLKRAEVGGGPVQTICEAPTGRGGTWNSEGTIVFTPSGQLIDGLYQVSASGGTLKRISVPDEARKEDSHRWPQFLPDGKHFLFLAANVSGETEPNAIYAGALGSDMKKFITKSTANPAYVEPGYLLFYRDQTLFAQRFDAQRLELSGEPAPLFSGLQFQPRIAHADYAAINGDTLLAQTGGAVSMTSLELYDRQGKVLQTIGKPDVYANVTLSPDGKEIALDKTDTVTQNTDIWIYEVNKDSSRRLTFNPAIDSRPTWSPDGSEVIFASSRNRQFKLFIKKADGSQEEQEIPAGSPDKADLYCGSWSPDKKLILYERGTELWVLNLANHESRPFLKGNFVLKSEQISPDGRWVAYTSNESGQWEVYVTSFPEAHGKWQVSSGGGEQPRWRGDGKELFFLSLDAKIMSVPVKTGTSFEAGSAVALFQANPREMVATSEQSAYDVSRDGQRFVINTKEKQADARPMTVILNWVGSLNKAQ